MNSLRKAIDWLKDKGFVSRFGNEALKADSETKTKHIGFDGLVAKLMEEGHSKESATKIAGKVYWEQQAAAGKGKSSANKADDKKAKCYPLPGEKQDAFMSRCMTHMTNDRGKEHEAALGACLGIWGEHGTKEKKT